MLSLDLRPSGGAAIEAIALNGNPKAYAFAVPMKVRGRSMAVFKFHPRAKSAQLSLSVSHL